MLMGEAHFISIISLYVYTHPHTPPFLLCLKPSPAIMISQVEASSRGSLWLQAAVFSAGSTAPKALSTLTNDSKLPLNSLTLNTERGLGLCVPNGLGGRLGGL